MLRLDFHFNRPALLVLGLHHSQSLHPGVGPGLDLPDVLFGHAHLAADHDQWQGYRELPHPVAVPLGEKGVHELVGGIAHKGIHLVDLLGTKRLVEHAAHLAMIGVVAPGERDARHPALFAIQIEHALSALRIDMSTSSAAPLIVFAGVGLGIQKHLAQVRKA